MVQDKLDVECVEFPHQATALAESAGSQYKRASPPYLTDVDGI